MACASPGPEHCNDLWLHNAMSVCDTELQAWAIALGGSPYPSPAHSHPVSRLAAGAPGLTTYPQRRTSGQDNRSRMTRSPAQAHTRPAAAPRPSPKNPRHGPQSEGGVAAGPATRQSRWRCRRKQKALLQRLRSAGDTRGQGASSVQHYSSAWLPQAVGPRFPSRMDREAVRWGHPVSPTGRGGFERGVLVSGQASGKAVECGGERMVQPRSVGICAPGPRGPWDWSRKQENWTGPIPDPAEAAVSAQRKGAESLDNGGGRFSPAQISAAYSLRNQTVLVSGHSQEASVPRPT